MTKDLVITGYGFTECPGGQIGNTLANSLVTRKYACSMQPGFTVPKGTNGQTNIVAVGGNNIHGSWHFDNGSLHGLQMEISISDSFHADYRLRVVLCNRDDNPTAQTSVCPAGIYVDEKGQAHPRGSWPWSEMLVRNASLPKTPLWDLYHAVFNWLTSSYNDVCGISCGSQDYFFGCARDNYGCYGAMVHALVEVDNICGKVPLQLPVQVLSDAPNVTTGALTYRNHSQITGDLSVNVAMQKLLHPYQYVGDFYVNAWSWDAFRLDWAMAGGGSTPVYIYTGKHK